MNTSDLRELQAPLKEKYRADPSAALITLRAEGQLGEGVTCRVETAKGMAQAGMHPGTGGTGWELCSGDMLLQALAACAGVTLNAVATALGVKLTSGKVIAEGDLDFRGTLGVDKTVPVGFRQIRLRFSVATEASPEQVEKLLQLTERYCVVYQTLRRTPTIDVSLERT
jgi:uncharacterized OsmC-like protein